MLTVDQQTYKITIDAGDQEKVKFTITNPDGTPYNGGSGIIAFVAKLSTEDAIGAAAINVVSNVVPAQWDMTNWTSGIAIFKFAAANTNALGGKNLNYAVKVTDGALEVHTVRTGLLEVRKNPSI